MGKSKKKKKRLKKKQQEQQQEKTETPKYYKINHKQWATGEAYTLVDQETYERYRKSKQ